tara:strand:- start:19 stop:429 length:411 start_codon:yes stop_codon:yes gene_type:complete
VQLKQKAMGIFDFFGKSKDKNKAQKYQRDNDLPEKAKVLGQTLYKRDMSGLQAYFKEMTNMERIFNEFTGAIRNGYTVEKYLNDANLMGDQEIKEIAARGFNDISSFLNDMLEIKENAELRKDYNACIEAVKILTR